MLLLLLFVLWKRPLFMQYLPSQYPQYFCKAIGYNKCIRTYCKCKTGRFLAQPCLHWYTWYCSSSKGLVHAELRNSENERKWAFRLDTYFNNFSSINALTITSETLLLCMKWGIQFFSLMKWTYVLIESNLLMWLTELREYPTWTFSSCLCVVRSSSYLARILEIWSFENMLLTGIPHL